MSNDIILNTAALQSYAQRINNVNNRIKRLDIRLNSLYTKVGLLGLYNLITADLLVCYSRRLQLCSNYLNQTAATFNSTENQLKALNPSSFSSSAFAWINPYFYPSTDRYRKPDYWEHFNAAIKRGAIAYGAATTVFSYIKENIWDEYWKGNLTYTDGSSRYERVSEDEENFEKVLTGTKSASMAPEYGKYKDKKVLGDKDHLNVNHEQQKKESKPYGADETWYKDPKATILEQKAEIKKEVSVLDGKRSGDNGWAEGSVEGKVLTAEAHAEAAAGLYVYTKDKDGKVNKVFSPGVSAEVGASASVLEGSAEGRIGLGEDKNMLGLYGEAEAKVLTAEAKAKFAVNSKEAYAGFNAEADLAKVTASGGVAVLGTDVGVTGSLKVGVGAHAEFGVTDGKIKVDFGVAVGVGFDLGLEVDVSGTVDAITDVATSVWDGAVDAWNHFFK